MNRPSNPKARKRTKKYYRKGYDRQVGFYGRFAGPKAELKFFDIAIDDAVVATGGTIQTHVPLITQGVGESQRVGRKIVVTKILWRYECTLLAVATGTAVSADTVRVIMYLDQQANGAAALVDDILTTNNYQSFNNLGNVDRFKILLDRTVAMNSQSGAGNGTANDYSQYRVAGTFFKDCSIPLEYGANTGVITEMRSNNIGVLLLSEGGLCKFESLIRLRYSDH